MQGGDGPYTIALAGETPTAGMFVMQGAEHEGIPPQWFSYIKVDDVDAAVAKVGAAGGAVRREPFDIPGIGRIAIIADPAGAALGLMTPAADG